MLRPIDKDRLKHIYQLLLKITDGDFAFEVERSDEDDEIEAILILVNLLVEEMKETLRYYNVLNTSESSRQYANMLFVLDSTFQIQFANAQVGENLGVSNTKIVNKSFSTLLSNKSLHSWKIIAQNIWHKPEFHTISKFTFLCHNQLNKTYTTAINVVPGNTQGNPLIIITTFETILKSKLVEEDLKQSLNILKTEKLKISKKPYVLVKENDIRIMQQIKDYILQNLEHPLPSLRSLANQFGTNEYKLKYGFKQLYQTTVFRFLIQERLKKASLLIQNTTLSIKAIAKMTGFKNVSHFSKAFKHRYGITPTNLKKAHNQS
ncbi:helix-turn-helix domain-containing protein [Mesoflavibacter zeaxanthinifaciens]|uniref:helix-turn-helix domain-containing protein n=1 Tax=Mesoflavibacter zeaxanthinifaciens TaxID=393060 RepID=UPI003A93D344